MVDATDDDDVCGCIMIMMMMYHDDDVCGCIMMMMMMYHDDDDDVS
jgi:hypothetical protein